MGDPMTIDELWQNHIDRDDRNSPEEYPEMALITFEEFKQNIEFYAETLTARLAASDAEVKALREALDPNLTKAAYIGEFRQRVKYRDEFGEDVVMECDVSWTTVKEIMAAIIARAALARGAGEK